MEEVKIQIEYTYASQCHVSMPVAQHAVVIKRLRVFSLELGPSSFGSLLQTKTWNRSQDSTLVHSEQLTPTFMRLGLLMV